MTEIRFWSRHDAYACFSNFTMYEIDIEGTLWPSVEHFYQASKTRNPDEITAIWQAYSPAEAKRLGRQVKLRPDWERIKENVMLRGLRAKFDQYPILAETLLGTGKRTLIENSPYDAYWGGGFPGSKNRLGTLLMQVRDELAQKAADQDNFDSVFA